MLLTESLLSLVFLAISCLPVRIWSSQQLQGSIVNYSNILGLCHPVNRICRKLSVRIKSTRIVIGSNPVQNIASGVDVVTLRRRWQRRTERNWRAGPRSFLIWFAIGWSDHQLYNSAMHNIDHLMFEYILNWPDQPSWLFLWLSLDLDKNGPFDNSSWHVGHLEPSSKGSIVSNLVKYPDQAAL